jgi:environmental stress-induced protein Ves
MQILRAADRRSMPWKNGGGITYEVAVSPEGAGLDGFDWRVSMARLQSDGPFSHFAGISRVLAMLEGEVKLTVGAAEPLAMRPDSPPLAFPGDAAVHGELVSPEALDLNVMTRAAAFEARLSRGSGPGTLERGRGVAAAMLVALGDLTVDGRSLGRLDVARLDDRAVQVAGPGAYWLIEIAARGG